MKKQLRFPKVFFFSLLSVFLLTALFSCKTEEESRTDEIQSSSSDSSSTDPVTYLVKEANYIQHYRQKIMTDSYGEKYITKQNEGFELHESEDKSDNPVEVRTEFKDLAKNYTGFSYSYAIQVDSTVYIYYTRNTVKYTFYDDTAPNPEVLKVVATLSGTYGMPCQLPNVRINGKLVLLWNESPDGSGSAFTNEFKPVDSSFYPIKPIKEVVGTKIRPTNVGDIVFCDGTAATLSEVKAATGETLIKYKRNAIAVIVFDRYDALTGSTSDGDKIIGVGIQALNTSYQNYPNLGTIDIKSEFKSKWRENDQYAPENLSPTYIFHSNHGYYDFIDLKNLFGKEEFDSSTTFENDWTAFFKAYKYCTLLKESKFEHVTDTDKEDLLADFDNSLLNGWYLPNWRELGLLLASNYKYCTTLKDACTALDIDFPDYSASHNVFWGTSSTSTTTENYAVYINPKNSYADLNMIMDTEQWAKVSIDEDTDSSYPKVFQVLPFREFK